MMTDPIADMLTRIRNAGQAKHKWVDMPVSSLKIEVARLLQPTVDVEPHQHIPQIVVEVCPGRGRPLCVGRVLAKL